MHYWFTLIALVALSWVLINRIVSVHMHKNGEYSFEDIAWNAFDFVFIALMLDNLIRM